MPSILDKYRATDPRRLTLPRASVHEDPLSVLFCQGTPSCDLGRCCNGLDAITALPVIGPRTVFIKRMMDHNIERHNVLKELCLWHILAQLR